MALDGVVLGLSRAPNFGGHTECNTSIRYRRCDYRAGAYNRAASDFNTIEYDDVISDPTVVSDLDPLAGDALLVYVPVSGKQMALSNETYIGSYLASHAYD
jgi:hypothetical protein